MQPLGTASLRLTPPRESLTPFWRKRKTTTEISHTAHDEAGSIAQILALLSVDTPRHPGHRGSEFRHALTVGAAPVCRRH